MESLMSTGVFPTKLSILQLAGIIGFALDNLCDDYKSFKSYEITRMDEHGGVEVIIDYFQTGWSRD